MPKLKAAATARIVVFIGILHLLVGRDVMGVAHPTILLAADLCAERWNVAVCLRRQQRRCWMHVDRGHSAAAATTALFADLSGSLVDLITDVFQLIERFDLQELSNGHVELVFVICDDLCAVCGLNCGALERHTPKIAKRSGKLMPQ